MPPSHPLFPSFRLALMPDAPRNASQQNTDHTFSEPVTDRIEMEDGPGHRLSVSFSPATPWPRVLGLSAALIAGPLFMGGMLLRPVLLSPHYRTAGPIAIVIACFAVIGAILYWMWTRWLHTATVVVENGAVTLINTPLFANGSTTTIPCEALDDVHVEVKTRNESSLYSLSLVQDPSRSTGARSDQKEIWVAGELSNGAEADWIADRIQKAAEQQASST